MQSLKCQELWQVTDFFPTCKVARYPASFIDAHRRHKTPGSETKDSTPHATANNTSFKFMSVLLSLPPQFGIAEVDAEHAEGLHHSWEIPSLGIPNIYNMLQAKLPQLLPQEDA